jgi:hypothetical protein
MRALFLEVLLDVARKNGLGMGAGCLEYFVQLIDSVITEHADELQNREKFIQAYAELEEFVQRMIQSAIAKGYSELHEDTFFDAREQCGLIWWCKAERR